MVSPSVGVLPLDSLPVIKDNQRLAMWGLDA